MPQTERGPDDGCEPSEFVPPPPDRRQNRASPKDPEYHPECHDDGFSIATEPAWCAARALVRLKCETLLAVMLRPSFRPIPDTTLVPIYPCPYCGDGGLRTAGTVRMRKGNAFVRACDTCCAVEVGEQQIFG